MRDCCYECGRKESYLSAFKQWFRWTRVGKWLRGYTQTIPGPMQQYFDAQLLRFATELLVTKRVDEFPKNAGKTTR